METYCASCKSKKIKTTTNENLSIRKTQQIIKMLLSICAVCGKKKSMLIKSQKVH